MASHLLEVASFITAALSGVGQAEAAPGMRTGAAAPPPPGYTALCARSPTDCGDDVAAVLKAALDAEIARIAWIMRPAPTAATGAEDAPDTRGKDARALTPSRWRALVTINTQVNRSIIAQPDQQTWGVEEYWAAPSDTGATGGDCEDYALEKRKALLKAGFPAASLNIAVVATPTGESHAVLLVATREGEFVLDNLSPWVRPWNATPYVWRVRQVNGEPFRWAEVG
jgi:predicted transglutaminase-like cysteine proteinase